MHQFSSFQLQNFGKDDTSRLAENRPDDSNPLTKPPMLRAKWRVPKD
jgi:hypothetical protein